VDSADAFNEHVAVGYDKAERGSGKVSDRGGFQQLVGRGLMVFLRTRRGIVLPRVLESRLYNSFASLRLLFWSRLWWSGRIGYERGRINIDIITFICISNEMIFRSSLAFTRSLSSPTVTGCIDDITCTYFTYEEGKASSRVTSLGMWHLRVFTSSSQASAAEQITNPPPVHLYGRSLQDGHKQRSDS
jgi:hypothetical protein